MKIRIKEEKEFVLVSYGVSTDSLFIELEYGGTFENLEADFQKVDSILYVLGNEDEKIESLHDFTKLDGIRKNLSNSEKVTYSVVLKKMSEFEILNKKILDTQLAMVEMYEGGDEE